MAHITPLQFQTTMLPDAGTTETGEVELRELDIADTPHLHFASPFRFSIHISKVGENNILAKGSGELTIRGPCDRCLEEFETEIEVPEICHYIEGVENEFVDLTAEVREDILLALPLRLTCRDDCRGLCPNCGGNLNQGDCRCQRETAGEANPWAALDGLVLDRQGPETGPGTPPKKGKIQRK